MKRLAFVPMLLLVFAAGCEDDPPTEPTPQTPTFAMPLLSSNEPSLPTPSEASCSGQCDDPVQPDQGLGAGDHRGHCRFSGEHHRLPDEYRHHGSHTFTGGVAGQNGGVW